MKPPPPDNATHAAAPTLFLSDADVADLADWRSAFEALRAAYAAPIAPGMVPPRSMARGDGLWLRGLTAVSPSGEHMGCKLIAASTRHRRASYLISLFHQASTALAALIDGNRITGIRTAATAAVAVDIAAARRPLRVAVIGAGFEARGLLEALLAVRAVALARVYSPTPASRESFAARFRDTAGLDIAAADTPAQAIAGANVVLCATRSRDETPVLMGEWLSPGMTVVSIGSTLPEQREVDTSVIGRASVIVADMPDEVAHDTGDMQAAARAGIDGGGKLVSLNDFVSGGHRHRPQDIVLYKSVGSALQDVITAEMLLAKAREQSRGTPLARSIETILK